MKQYLSEFRVLDVSELLAVNGGYGSSYSKYPVPSGTPYGIPGGPAPETLVPVSLPGTNGGNSDSLLDDSITANDGTIYQNNCDDWVIGVLDDAGVSIGESALQGDKNCEQRRTELINECDNEISLTSDMQTDQWYLGCSSDHMFLVKKNDDGSYSVADSTGYDGWNNGLSGEHSVNNFAASQTYGGSDAIYVPVQM